MTRVEFQSKEFSQQEWADLTASSQGLSLLQTWEYGEARAGSGLVVERGRFVAGGEVVGSCQALARRVPIFRGGAVWINRGPLTTRDDPDGSLMSEMLSTLREYWVGQRGFYLRIAPLLRADRASALPEGYESTGARGWSSSRVDLRQAVDDLRRGLHQKWRNCLNKAERLPLTVTASTEPVDFAAFLRDYESFILEKDFTTSVTPELLRRLQGLLPPERRMVVVRATAADGRAMGMILIALYGKAGEYLAGSVRDEGRAMNAGHLLLWNAVLYLKDRGSETLDLGGMDPELTPKGILHFKEGIGGEPYRLINELESDDGRLISRVVAARVRRRRASVEVRG
jgi:lipid II:glycine glycyltransferase (peptidoglycan interpeptide bridge formation enzyme)